MKNKFLIGGSAIAVFVLIFASLSPVVGFGIVDLNNDLSEVTIDIIGNKKIDSYKLILSEERKREIEHLLDKINVEFENAKSSSEKEDVFYWALFELNRYDLVPNDKYEELLNSKSSNFFNYIRNKLDKFLENDNIKNIFCLVFADISDCFTLQFNWIMFIIPFFAILGFQNIASIILGYAYLKPLRFLNYIILGKDSYTGMEDIHTLGLLGYKKINIGESYFCELIGYSGLYIKMDSHTIFIGHSILAIQ